MSSRTCCSVTEVPDEPGSELDAGFDLISSSFSGGRSTTTVGSGGGLDGTCVTTTSSSGGRDFTVVTDGSEDDEDGVTASC